MQYVHTVMLINYTVDTINAGQGRAPSFKEDGSCNPEIETLDIMKVGVCRRGLVHCRARVDVSRVAALA